MEFIYFVLNLSKMAGICYYNFTVGFVTKVPDIMSDGQNKLKGIFGIHYDNFFGYKNER